MREGDVNPERVMRMEKKLKIKHVEIKNKSEVMSKLKQAWKDLRTVQKNAIKHQKEHLESLVEFYAAQKDTSRAVEIKKLHHIEQVKRMAAKHRWWLKKNYGMIRHILIPEYVVEKRNPTLASLLILAYTIGELM